MVNPHNGAKVTTNTKFLPMWIARGFEIHSVEIEGTIPPVPSTVPDELPDNIIEVVLDDNDKLTRKEEDGAIV